RFEQLFLYPEVCPPRFDLLGFVRLCYLARHPMRFSRVVAGLLTRSSLLQAVLARPFDELESFRVIFDYTRAKAAASIRWPEVARNKIPFGSLETAEGFLK